MRTAVSGTGVSLVVEGPLPGKRGSWLASARQSYLDLVIDRLVDDQVQFGFSDAQTKFVYDLSPSQRVQMTDRGRPFPARGAQGGDRRERSLRRVECVGSRHRHLAMVGEPKRSERGRHGRRQPVSQRDASRHRPRQRARTAVERPRRRAAPVDAAHRARSRRRSRVLRESRRRQRPVTASTYRVINDYSGDATRAGAYASARWSVGPRLTLLPGVRADHWTLTDDSTVSPWLQAVWRVSAGTTVRGATGLYQQFPGFEQVIGAWGTPVLSAERATQFDVGVEQAIGQSARMQVTLYDREDNDFLRRAGAEPRLVNGRLVPGSRTVRYENRVDGSARGVEMMLQRLDANSFSGWISYSYGRNRYQDTTSQETYWGDLDQRHTFNLYGTYRLSPRTSVSGKLRMGSNFPAPGYYDESDGRYYVGETKNDVRLPSFARLDLRVNRTFTWSTRRLTLFVEVINVLNRENVRYHPPSIDARTFEARRLFESLLPVVPSAGLLFEF